MYQVEMLVQREDGREVIMSVANHALKSAIKWLGGTHEEGEHIHG